MRRSTSLCRAPGLMLAVALGCGGSAPARPGPIPAPVVPVVSSRLTRVPDANTAAILLMSHNVVLAAARVAATRAQSRDVKLLARNLVTDHTAMAGTLSRLLASIEL